MKTSSPVRLVAVRLAQLVLGGTLAAAGLFAAAPKSDILPPGRREVSVDLGEKLAQVQKPDPMPADIASPFNPPEFDKPDATELAARQQRAPAAGSGATPRPPGAGATAATPPPATGGPVLSPDREVLEKLAEMIKPSGTINLGGRPLLMVQGRRLQIGDSFIVAYDGQDYELALVAIDRTTFTLRYRNEETTRPIRPVR